MKKEETVRIIQIFDRMVKPLRAIGVGRKFPLTYKMYMKFVEQVYKIIGPSDKSVLIEAQGVKYWVDTENMGSNMFSMLVRGVYEPTETKLFKQFIKKGMNIVDLGAHAGYYSIIAAKLVGQEGKVYAFEPNDHCYNLLCRTIKANNFTNIIPVKKAVSDKNGKIDFFVDSIYNIHTIPNTEKQVVDTTTLDDFLHENDSTTKIDIIKMDIEGAEYLALKGMKKTIENSDNMILFMEFTPSVMKVDPRKELELLEGYKFEVYNINEPKGRVERWTGDFDLSKQYNFLCVKKRLNETIESQYLGRRVK